MNIKQNRGVPFSGAFTGTTLAIGTQAGVANQTIYLTDFSASSDATSGAVTIQSGSTTLWADKIGSTNPYVVNLTQPIACAVGATLTVTTSGTAKTYCNFSGFIINNT